MLAAAQRVLELTRRVVLDDPEPMSVSAPQQHDTRRRRAPGASRPDAQGRRRERIG